MADCLCFAGIAQKVLPSRPPAGTPKARHFASHRNKKSISFRWNENKIVE
jgi:hypothetical protein